MVRIEISDDCTVCGICVHSCPALILVTISTNDTRLLNCKDKARCLECRACEFLCPHDAISVHA